jgi:hypothetical protein
MAVAAPEDRFSWVISSRPRQHRPLQNRSTVILLVAAYMASILSSSLPIMTPNRQLSIFEDTKPGMYPTDPDFAKESISILHQHENPMSLYTTPTDDNTLITLIAMGLPADMYLTERCVRSIRARGNFTGYIMIFTNHMERYQKSLSDHDDKIVLVQGKPEDVRPTYANGTCIPYSKHTMKYKRYKTLASKYLQEDPRLNTNIRYVMYLDIDNVVTNPLQNLFRDYQDKVNRDYAQTGAASLSGHSLVSFWMDPGTTHMMQGGQFLVERYHGQPCLDAWRDEMDQQVQSDRDQPLLMDVARQFDKYRCLVSILPNGGGGGERRHFDMLQTDILDMTRPEQYPTIVHISGHRAKLYPETQQRGFLKQALDLEQMSRDASIGGVPLENLLQPMSVKGQRPKRE